MRLPTVRIRNKKTGDVRKINQHEWAGDLGVSRFAGWTLDGGETRGDASDAEVKVQQEEDEANHLRLDGDSQPETIASKEPLPESLEGLPKPTRGRSRGK